MYSGTRDVKVKSQTKEYAPDLSSTSAAIKSLKYAESKLKPEQAEAVRDQVGKAYPDVLISRRRTS